MTHAALTCSRRAARDIASRPRRLPADMSRERVAILVVGALAMAVFCVLCVRKNVALIQEDLSERTAAALAAEDVDWARVRISGRDLTVSGIPPSSLAAARALEAIGAIEGVRVVHDRLDAPAAPVAAPPPPVPPAYELTITFDGTGLALEGFVPDEAALEELNRRAGIRFGALAVRSAVQTAAGAPEDWLGAAGAAVDALAWLDAGEATLAEGSLLLSGTVADGPAFVRLRESLDKSLPAAYAADLSGAAAIVEVPAAATLPESPPAPTPAAPDSPAAACQAGLTAALAESPIVFESGSARIGAASHALLDALAAIAGSCPRARIEIAGHTDATGRRADNIALSQARAEAVMAELVARGVALRRLTARGYGEARPLTHNATQAARARNRRIQLIVQGEG